MKVTTLGAAKEVGRSAFLVNSNNTNILLDYGVLLKKEPVFPIQVKPKEIDAVVITHAHLDHSGNVPFLFLNTDSKVKALGTLPTFELSQLLIQDMIKISGFYLPFDYPDLMNMLNHSINLEYRTKFGIRDVNVTLFESGHVLGGSTVIVEGEGKRILYTGDINTRGSKVLRPADLDVGEIDLLIIESTYSQAEQLPRDQSERELVKHALDVVERKGILFVPAFSVERAQEIACVLKAYDFPYKIAMDGMALKANQIMLKHPKFLRDSEVFKRSIEEVQSITSWDRRKRVIKEPGVIISPAGMLVGGSGVFYLQELSKNELNSIALVSYQGEGTPGRLLLDKRQVTFGGNTIKCLAEINRFEFSGHNSRKELFEILDKVKGNPSVLTVHGDNLACTKFAEEITEKYGFKAQAPDPAEVTTV
ncbi:MAG: MBL fold metallo-hydrolase [Candidatus Nitrosocosmicus sp.]